MYNKDLGSFPGNGFMLEFSDYFNESSHRYYGYTTFLLTLSPSVTQNKFNKGMAAILFDAENGEVSLIESIFDVKATKDDPAEKGDPSRDEQFVVKQKILQSDYCKAGNLIHKTFRIYFLPAGDDINLMLDIEGKIVSGIIDGGEWKRYYAGTPTVFSSDKSGEHIIKIMSPYENTTPKISGLYSDVFVKTLSADQKKTIIFIGDSATAGYSTTNNKFEKSIANNYALQVAKRLDYAVSIVANANATIVAGEGTDKLGMPARYFKLGELNSDAQDKNYAVNNEPDCVVVFLGSYGTNGGNNVQSAYESFIKKLRRSYPDSTIVCMTPVSNKNVDVIKKSVGNMQKEGDKNVYFLNASEWGVELCTDGINPTQSGHKTMASKLTAVLKSIMSGKVTISVTSQKPASNTQSKLTSSREQEDVSQPQDSEESYEVVEEIVEEEQEGNSIKDYIWLIILTAAIAVISILAVIFWPNIKKMFNKNKHKEK